MVFQGSKSKYTKDIIPILIKEIKQYDPKLVIDGMCGGCNVISEIPDTFDDYPYYLDKHAYDINPYLIDLYKYAKAYPDKWPETITREDWDKAKNHPEQCEPWFVALVAYFTSYSARGFGGGFAMNGTRDYYHERLRNFQTQIPKLATVWFECKSVFDIDTEHCLIYLDPPYANTKGYDYCKNFDHEKFWQKVRELSQNNRVIVSEQTAPEDFVPIWTKETNRNAFGAGLTRATENLFVLAEE